MSDNITDLDALVASPKKVSLGGRTYTVPGDIPMEVYVKVNKAEMLGNSDEAESIEVMVDALTDLFTAVSEDLPNYEQLREDVNKVLRRSGVRVIFKMLNAIYSTPAEVVESEDDAPTPPEAG